LRQGWRRSQRQRPGQRKSVCPADPYHGAILPSD
jgi:hypothetical protein